MNSFAYKLGNIVGTAEMIYFSYVSVVATGGSIRFLSPTIGIQGVAANYVQGRPYTAVHGGVQIFGTDAIGALPGGRPVAGVMDVVYSVISGIYDE